MFSRQKQRRMDGPRWCRVALTLLLAGVPGAGLHAQATGDGVLAGTVRRLPAEGGAAGAGLRGAAVRLLEGTVLRAEASTDEGGSYRLSAAAGEYTLDVRLPGYVASRVSVRLASGVTTTLDVTLTEQSTVLDRVVVSTARQPERVSEAAASVTVVEAAAVRERVTTSPLDHVLGTPGVDVAVQGLQGRQVVGRGFNGTFGPSLMLLSDWRNAQLPSIRASLSYFLTPSDDDIERVEVVRGPASALYGSNAADGVVHVLTKSPFASPGTSLSVTGGGRSLLSGSVRHAAVLGDRFAVRVSGTYFRGREWSVPPQPSEQLPRDPIAERVNAEVRADYRVSSTGTAVFSAGTTTALRTVEYTPIGSYQLDHSRAHHAQVRYSDGAFFAQGYLNAARSPAGATVNLQTGQTAIDRSMLGVLQLQHGRTVGRTRLTYGVDLQRTTPQTEGTVNGRNEDDDGVLESGLYVQASTRLTDRVQLLTAARADRHSRLDGTQWSPRVGLIVTPRAGERLMVSYNRAFSTPTPGNLFLDVVAARLTPLPYTIRAVGVPRDGIQFARSCDGGLCMVSPFAPGTRMPLDATRLWGVVVQTLRAAGVDLSGLPAPRRDDVATVLRGLDLRSGTFVTSSAPSDIVPLRPTVTNSVEAAYTRLVGGRLVVDVSVYGTWRKDFIAPLTLATPNVFLSTASLAAYLGRFLPAVQAGQLAAGIGGVDGNAQAPGIPLGTVAPLGGYADDDILLTYRNVGDVQLWGADLALTYAATDRLQLAASYSHVSDNFFPANGPGEIDVSTNAPRRKALVSARYRVPARDASIEIRGRSVGAFRMADGVWNGDVPAFTVADLEAGIAIPGVRRTRATLTVQNVADNRHVEFYSAPILGRLVLTRIQYQF